MAREGRHDNYDEIIATLTDMLIDVLWIILSMIHNLGEHFLAKNQDNQT